MIPMSRSAFAPAMVLLVGLGSALPALAWPLRPTVDRHPGSPPTVLVDCNVGLRNACYLRMNECLYRHSNRPYSGDIRACEAAYFDCINRFKCQRGPVW